MLMDPFPSLDNVFSLVVQQERQLIGYDAEPRLVAAVGRGNGFGRGFGRGNGELLKYNGGKGANNGKVCTYCGKNGHTIDTCYRKHGFPPNFKFKNQGQVNSVASNDVNKSNETDRGSNILKEENANSVFGLTAEQYEGLVKLLHQSQPQPAIHSQIM